MPPKITAKAAFTAEVVSPTTSQWPELIEASGSIAPWQGADRQSRSQPRRLEEVLVNDGAAVAPA